MKKGGGFLTFLYIFIILILISGLVIIGNKFFGTLFEDLPTVQELVPSTEIGPELKNQIKTPQIVENPVAEEDLTEEPADDIVAPVGLKSNFFYNQLDENSKTIYNGLWNHKEELKSGTYKVQYGGTFQDLLSESNGQEKLGNAYQSAIEAFSYDNPDVFYLNPNKMYLNIQTETRGTSVKYKVFIDNGKQDSYLADGFKSKEQVEKVEKQIENIRDQIVNAVSGTNEQKARQVHNYLVDNITYDETLSKDNIYDIYGALVKGESVCEGYAKSYQYILNAIGIPCVIVIGTGTNSQGQTENHSWNYVQLNNKWYAVDVTWDDPIIHGGGTLTNSSRYQYFLRGKNKMDKDHFTDGQFTEGGKVFKFPQLSSVDYTK